MRKSKIVGVLVAAASLIIASATLYLALTGDEDEVAPPDVLVELALNGATPMEREQAALDLARSTSPNAVAGLRRVLAESRYADSRAAAIEGLGFKKDLSSMPNFVKFAKDEGQPKNVRGRAGAAITRLLSYANFGWDLDKEQTPSQIDKLNSMAEMGTLMWEYRIPPR